MVGEKIKVENSKDNGMRKLTVSIPDELDAKIREYADRESGMKGGLSMAVKKAIEEFLASHQAS